MTWPVGLGAISFFAAGTLLITDDSVGVKLVGALCFVCIPARILVGGRR